MSKTSLSFYLFITLVFFLAVIDSQIVNTPQTHGLFGHLLAPATALCFVSFPFVLVNIRKSLKENRKLETVILGFALLPGILLLLLVCAYTIGLN
jgi:FtsH-binding integral membrane protein